MAITAGPSATDRLIELGAGLPGIPERLLLEHSRGNVLFIAGAGISRPSGLPGFRELALNVIAKLDLSLHAILNAKPAQAKKGLESAGSGLEPEQVAIGRRFLQGDYDVALGMLERKNDPLATSASKVRQAIVKEIDRPKTNPAAIHRALMRLADASGRAFIATTNFDRLLERASKTKPKLATLALGSIPRPGRGPDFAGVFHIHGALSNRANPELVISDLDFGEYYFRRQSVTEFIYDAARLYHIVLVGYSASDPPMRYLLNAVAADGTRFGDLKERFTFVGASARDEAELADWRMRGITPIFYDSANDHALLATLLRRWADLFAGDAKGRRG